MPPTFENPPGVPPPQAHYSHVARAGSTLYISGQLGVAADGQPVALGDARAQARQAWANLAAIVASYGADLSAIAKTTTFITHWGYRQPVAQARDEVLPGPRYPANTLVVVQGLAEPHFLVEIEAVAVLD